MKPSNPFVLPSTLQSALGALGEEIRKGRADALQADLVVGQLGDFPLHSVSSIMRQVQVAAGLYHRPAAIGSGGRFWPPNWLRDRATDLDLLARIPPLRLLYLFHADGRLREAALASLGGPLPTPFWTVAVGYRLNDRVGQVRRAAAACFARAAVETEAEIIAEALIFLAGRRETWGRWTGESAILDELLTEPPIAEAVSRRLASGLVGPLSRALRQMLRGPSLDARLFDLARQARQPAVRAAALSALVDGRVRWPTGSFERTWIDKSSGRFGYAATFRDRPIDHGWPLDTLVALGLGDRAAAVRKVAATALVRHAALAKQFESVARPLLRDKSSRVREAIAYALRRADEQPATDCG